MPKFTQDQRVVVEVADQDGWNRDVLSVLQGKTGAICTVKTHHNNGQVQVPIDPPRYFVLFDAPTERTSRGMTHSGFWFDENDLKEFPC